MYTAQPESCLISSAHFSTRACSSAWVLLVLSPSSSTASRPRAACAAASSMAAWAAAFPVKWVSEITRMLSA